ncbi:MAG: dicarboxylate/amino acid:cation symporter [Bacilli bacterium]|nr:dicarboxylate/amino acid:cation symporter [Bacilli bacterium]
MKVFWKNYKNTILLILALVIGAISGVIFKEDVNMVKPLGDLFLNALFVTIVPLLFLTITTTIAKMESKGRLRKIFGRIIVISLITSLVAIIFGVLTTNTFKLVNPRDTKVIKDAFSTSKVKSPKLNFLESTVNLISVDDFGGLLSKGNVVAIVVFSIIFGFAMRRDAKKTKPLLDVLESANTTILNVINIIMYYAPIGIGCYFASLVGTFGAEIAKGYLRTFIIYSVCALVFYFVFYTLYAFIAGGKKAVKAFWGNAIEPTFTSLSTCSSAASLPVNIKSAKKMGIPDDVSETFIALGTSLHQDGSIIGTVFKTMFLVCLFGGNIDIIQIIFVALTATLLITAVPIGGGTISESLIISMLGYPMAALPLLTMVATVIDPAATLLNVVGDEAAAMLVARSVDGKNWMRK